MSEILSTVRILQHTTIKKKSFVRFIVRLSAEVQQRVMHMRINNKEELQTKG